MRLPATAIRRFGVYAGLALLFVAAWLWLPKIYALSDPVGYLLRAWNLGGLAEWGPVGFRRWTFEWARIAQPDPLPFDYRLGLLLPHWAAYQLLGVSHFTSFLPQLGFLLVLLFCVLHCCRGLAQRLVAAAALATLLPFSVDVYPDLGVACMMFLALLLLDRGRGHGLGSGRQALYGMAFSLAAFYAFLVKLTALFLLAPFLMMLAADWLRRQSALRFYGAAALTGMALLAAYLLFCHLIYGDPFSRLHAINKVGEKHLWNMQGADAYLHRLFIAPAGFFWGFFGVAFALALAQAGVTLWQGRGQRKGGPGEPGRKDSRLQLIALYFLAGLAFALFTPTSFTSWQPLPLSERMFLFLAPAMAVLAARLVGDLWRFGFRGCWSGLGAGRRQEPRRPSMAARTMAVALLLATAYPGASKLFNMGSNPRLPSGEEARRMAMQALRENDQALLLVADDRSYEYLILYARFDPALYSRVRHCEAAPAPSGADAGNVSAIYVDKPLGDFLHRAYGRRHCSDELLALAAAHGFETLVARGGIYLGQGEIPQ